MDAIRELQKKLKAAQKGSNVKKISERNCIDLLQKLIATDQARLIHTTSGKEWLTPEQLDHEIRDALLSSGGRLSITELPNEVGVAAEHCESRVEHLRKKDGSLVRLHGELLTSQYLQSVAQDVSESLAEVGCLAVADLAARFGLPADFIKESVLPHVDATGLVMKQNAIYTGTHAARVEARVRGMLRGCTQPAVLANLAGRHGLDVEMLTAAAQKALKDGTVLGKIQGSTFIPKAYSDAQASRVDSFFSSNQYLPFSLAKSAGVEPKDWVKSKRIEGFGLHTAFLASQLAESALASVLEALSSESWIDVQPLLPPALTDADACELLSQLARQKRLPVTALVLGRVAMSSGFIKGMVSQFEKEVKAAAERALSAPQAKSGKKAVPVAEDDDDGASKKKGRRAAKGRKGRADDDDAAGDGGAGGGPGSGGGDLGIEDQAVFDVLFDKYPEIPQEVHSELLERIRPLLAAQVAEEQAALRSSLHSKQQAQFEHAERLVQERYETLVFGLRALEATGTQESPLQQHLLREAVAEPLHQMLALRLHEATGNTLEVTAANRKQCLDKLLAAEGSAKVESLARLGAVFSKGKEAKDSKEGKEPKEDKKSSKGKRGDKDSKTDKKAKDDEDGDAPTEVSELYHAAAGDCHIFCRKVDKKREKTLIQEKRAEHRDKLKELTVSDSAHVFCLGLKLALLEDGVPGLLFPEESWAFRIVAQALKDEDPREKALCLCGLLEKADDPVALEAAVSDWRERSLGGK